MGSEGKPLKFTNRNPDGKTFRVPIERLGEFRILQVGGSIAIYGDMVNLLGRYEAALTVDEVEAYARGRK